MAEHHAIKPLAVFEAAEYGERTRNSKRVLESRTELRFKQHRRQGRLQGLRPWGEVGGFGGTGGFAGTVVMGFCVLRIWNTSRGLAPLS